MLPQAARAQLLRGAATRDPDATFIPAPGVRRPAPTTALSNLVIAGAWTDTGWPATIESAVRSGRTAAHTLFRKVAGWSSATVGARRMHAGGGPCRLKRCAPPSTGCSSIRMPGWWSGELETNVTMTAEHVLLLRFLGVSHDDIRDGAIRHILGAQREDGTWALYHDGPGDLSTTIEAYVALRVLGIDATHAAMRSALRRILDQGGLAEARVFTKIWLALFGAYPWDGVPSMPPELVRLPAWAPLNLYDFACWARGTIAPLLIVISRRPVRDLGVSVDELIVPGSERRMHRVAGSGAFLWLDHALKLYDRLPLQPGRARSRAQARRVDHRASGGRRWLGRHPAAVGVLADRAQPRGHGRRSPRHAARARGIRALRHRRRRRVAAPGVHVAGVGHGVGDARAAQGRDLARSRGAAQRG